MFSLGYRQNQPYALIYIHNTYPPPSHTYKAHRAMCNIMYTYYQCCTIGFIMHGRVGLTIHRNQLDISYRVLATTNKWKYTYIIMLTQTNAVYSVE